MIRFLLKFGVVCALIFTLSIALIRAQTHDDSALQIMLALPENCPVSCFMGIRPGETMLREALDVLRTSDWVRSIQYMDRAMGRLTYTGWIRWEWSGRQPVWVDTDRDSLIWIDENRVDQISIPVRYRLGEIWLAYGDPDYGRLFVSPNANLWIAYRGVYVEQGFFVEAGGACPARNYWQEQAMLNFRSGLSVSVPDTSDGDSGIPSDMIRCVLWTIE